MVEPGAVDRRDRQARTSYGPSRAARDAAGVSGAQDRRGDRHRPPACGPLHSSNDPKNRAAPALERSGASARHPIDSRGRSCLRLGVLPEYVVPARCRPVRRWTCQNREQRILSDFALNRGRSHSPGPRLRVNRAPCADFVASPKCRETYQTVWRRGEDSNPRDPSGFEGRNSARVWRTIRPEKEHRRWREFVRLGSRHDAQRASSCLSVWQLKKSTK